jgi:GNAT superfamily N-acetyltransferase
MNINKDLEFSKQLKFEPLSKDNWSKFVQFFEKNGACGKCYCMFFRLKKQDFEDGKIDGSNKELMKKLVWDNQPTGMIGFYEEVPIGWCAFAPRENYLKVENSRVHKRIDDKPVWSITCFFVERPFRKLGVSVELLKAVIEYARKKKIKTLEAYPTIPTTEVISDGFAWIGLYKSFEQAGFKIVDKTSKYRPMVRYET